MVNNRWGKLHSEEVHNLYPSLHGQMRTQFCQQTSIEEIIQKVQMGGLTLNQMLERYYVSISNGLENCDADEQKILDSMEVRNFSIS